ncbi:DNA repair exonuclease [Geitlerinema sp. PCC 7407]|uniref:metallophosphoesterase family protein n=1 Tax=Geitlerinema sp. PCC 7407 TaxID=1173025 RepID=UPI00029F9AC6|nr:DNA repair exonuclease [Geitlerinema sp. PCC 7407]AFY66201.1 metallophosphoesterase [Geitlerinema sp. PCC 7407]
MVRFLHLSDVHLGFNRYGSAERTKDFYLALDDVIERYAIAAQVDFVLIAGDLFEDRQILPATLNQAKLCLQKLQDAAIPVFAIEGNHDNCPYGTQTSWLRYLSSWDYLVLLEPYDGESGPEYEPWDPESHSGGYVDLPCGVRIIGSRWYGASAPQMIRKIAEAIAALPPGPDKTIMMFHHGLEGQIARYNGALRYQELLPLREAGVDYLALGHIHRHYEKEGWIFNPGSLEANSIVENQAQNPRGVLLVEMDETGIRADLRRDYYQRPIRRLIFKTEKQMTSDDLAAGAIAQIEAAAQRGETQGALVEMVIQGQTGFNRVDLNLKTLRDRLKTLSGALILLLKYEAVGTEYRTPALAGTGNAPTRAQIEQQVFLDLLTANTRYETHAPRLAAGLTDLKDRVLDNQAEDTLYEFVQDLLDTLETPQASGSLGA